MNIVLDTNVFISGIFWKGKPHEIIRMAEESRIEIAATEEVLEELLDFLKRAKFSHLYKEGKTNPQEVFEKILALANIFYPPMDKITAIKEDPDDNKFLACALAAQASFIVSGDQHLLKLEKFQNILIATPAEFLKYFKERGITAQ